MEFDCLKRSASSLANGIRTRELSSIDVVNAHISELQRVNPRINAVVAERFDLAREEAHAADEAVTRGDALAERPLHGVPCTIKESFAVEGMPNTAGLVSRRGVRPSSDAITVARLREAGAIVMGVTNTSELCMWMESNNRVYGRSRNPYDLRRTVGGSSGGEGAIIGSGASPFGLGADVGGSIRMPAFFNGVFGHKPSPGIVPNQGQYPTTETPSGDRLLSTGPLCRRAEDLFPLLKILSGAHEGHGGDLPPETPGDIDVSSLRVIVVADDGGRNRVSSDITSGLRAAAAHLRGQGAVVEERRFKSLKYALEFWAVCMHESSETSFTDRLADGARFSAVKELVKASMRRSDFTIPALGLSLIERIPAFQPDRVRKLLGIRDALRAEILEALGPSGVMLYPPYPTVAPKHARALFPPTKAAYTAALNALEFGVTQAPLGLSRHGIPIGVQIAAGPGADHRTIAVAMELERAFGGWHPPAL